MSSEAFPVWAGAGVDRRRGGFVEALTHSGVPLDLPRRARVQARQLYCFTIAGTLGWSGDGEAIVRDGLRWFEQRYRRSDGLIRTLVDGNGRPLDDSVVLYDQAFALFALAACVPQAGPDLGADAVAHLNRLVARQKHAIAGFDEAPERPLPLLSNPHMHLLEAALAWEALTGAAMWRHLADEIAGLAMERLVDPVSGSVREYFSADWSAAPGVEGRIVEPGHQYEWAWLLLRWAGLRRRDDAAAAALRMIDLAEAHGVDPARGVAVNAILTDGTPHDPRARLWPQTERIKAAAAAALWTGKSHYWTLAAAATEGLESYLSGTAPGLWRDMMEPDGHFSDTETPASSFYHIVCAIAELDAAVETAARDATGEVSG